MNWVLILSAVLAVELAPVLEQFPADPPESVIEVYAAFNAAPKETVRGLVEQMGSDTNSAVRYAFDGWANHVLRPDATPEERAGLAGGLAELIAETEEPEVRRFLLQQIGKVGVRESIESVGQLLGDPEWAQDASLAIQSFGLPDYAEEVADVARPYLAAAEQYQNILNQLVGEGGKAPWTVERCREQLESEADHQVCEALVTLHGLIGDDAFPELSDAMDHPEPSVRAVALKLLAMSNAEPLVPWLKQRLDHEDPQCRAEALEVLIQKGDPDIKDRALSMMTDENAVVRRVAFDAAPANRLLSAYVTAENEERAALFHALVQRWGPSIASQARDVSQAFSDPLVQAAMLDVIGKCMAREYVGDALSAVRSEDEALAKQAVETLKRMASVKESGAILELMKDVELTLPLRSSLVPALVATLNEASDDEGRVAPLRNSLPESSSAVRLMLHRVLTGVHAFEAVTLLQADTAHSEETIRDSAVTSLCKWNGFEAAAPLLEVARATTNETHNALALRRMVQLVKKHQAADDENVERQTEARERYEAALAVAIRDDVKATIQDALDELVEKQKEEENADE